MNDMTPEELDRFKESFKKQEFRKLFFDYMDEISDPKNRQVIDVKYSYMKKNWSSWKKKKDLI